LGKASKASAFSDGVSAAQIEAAQRNSRVNIVVRWNFCMGASKNLCSQSAQGQAAMGA